MDDERSKDTESIERVQAEARVWPSMAMLMHAAFQGHGLPAKVRFELGLERVEIYVRAAQVQVARLDAPVGGYMESVSAEPVAAMPEWPSGPLFADAHFYFICWDAVAKELASLRSNKAGLLTPRKVWRKYRKSLERYQEARNHLEHYSERLPMGKHSEWRHGRADDPRNRCDLSQDQSAYYRCAQFAGGHVETLQGDPGAVRLGARFTINGEEWDVSVAIAKILESLWEELVVGLRRETEVRFAAWEKELRTQPAKT